MLGGILKLIFSFSTLFLFVTLLWQASITDASPTLAVNNNMAKSNEDGSHLLSINSHSGAPVVKSSVHSTVDQQMLIDRLYSPSLHNRHLKKNSHSNFVKSFQSTGPYNKNLRAAKRIKAVLENRLKRFRMLDQDEFQEMLKSMSQQSSDEQSKASNGMDSIGGMQLANYWSRK